MGRHFVVVHVLIPQTCEYVILHFKKRDLAEVTKIKDDEIQRLSLII